MFADVVADFSDRVQEVDLYFVFLASLENDEIAVVRGTGPQVVPVGTHPADWIKMLKGTGYLVIYNLVEAFIRRGFDEVFDYIRNDGVTAIELTEHLRKQWVIQRNRKVTAFDGSPKVYIEIANEIVTHIVNKEVAELSRDFLPFSGNLDADAIRDVCSRHGVSHNTPQQARGGAALTTVKTKRNSLSHGDESFMECGRAVVVSDLTKAKDEIVAFVGGILNNLQQFATSKSYKI